MDRRATPMKAKKHPMKTDQMVLGVLDISETMSDSLVADKYRDLTISWSRYDYRGELIEDTSVNAILDRAGMLGYRWCLILPYGHVIAERWRPEHWRGPDFASALRDRMDHDDFLVAGSIRADDDAWFGFENQCVLVNLDMYQQLGAPSFDSVCEQPIELPKAEQRIEAGRIAALVPSGESESRQPTMTGWHFIATSLRGGVPVVGFDEPLSEGILDLSATCPARAQAIANYFHAGIVNYDPEATHCGPGTGSSRLPEYGSAANDRGPQRCVLVEYRSLRRHRDSPRRFPVTDRLALQRGCWLQTESNPADAWMGPVDPSGLF